MRDTPIINIDRLEYMQIGDGGKFQGRLARIAPLLGARDLGFNITRVPPGKRAFPFHLHHGIEEMFFVLEGEGTLRLGEEEHPVRQGDFMAFPAGPHGGHQIINTGETELAYLAVSTMRSPEIVEYPDSGKIGAMAGTFSGASPDIHLRLFVRPESGVDYFDGESGD